MQLGDGYYSAAERADVLQFSRQNMPMGKYHWFSTFSLIHRPVRQLLVPCLTLRSANNSSQTYSLIEHFNRLIYIININAII